MPGQFFLFAAQQVDAQVANSLVTALRARTMLNLPGTRSELIKAMRARGIAIDDGMTTGTMDSPTANQ